MANRTDRWKQLNEIDASNVDFCEMLTSSYKLEDLFPDEPYLVSVFKNYRTRKLDELTLFWCFLVTFMHWSCETKLFDKDQTDYINLNLYGILRGNSVSHKSGYIKPIRKAFDFVEQYFRSQFIDSNNKFASTCIESLTPAKLLVELESSSKFISSDEDRPLTDFSFFEPTTPKAKEAGSCLISAFDGAYKLQRSTMTYSKDIRDKSLTMLIPTTGDQWPLLLNCFSDSYQTNGLYERILYWVIGKKNFVYEDLPLNEELPCLEYLYITRMLIGKRIYEYDDDALSYLRPILHKMRHNLPSYQGLCDIPKTKRAEACERRGADLIERIAVIVQNIIDTLKVLEPIKSINFNNIKKDTLNEIKANIGNYFYSNEMLSQVGKNVSYPDGVDLQYLSEVQIASVNKAPSESMKVRLPAAKIAVTFFHKLLLPQSIQLFSADVVDDKKSMLNELKIIQYPVNCFSMSDLTHTGVFHNHKRENIDVKQLLSALEKKGVLKCGKFIKSTFRLVESWIKMLPDVTNEEEVQQFKNELNTSYQLDFEKYIDLYENGVDDKSSLTETAVNMLSTQRSWIKDMRQKIHDPSIGNKISESTIESFPVLPRIEQTTACFDVAQVHIDLINNERSEAIDIIVEGIDIPSVIGDSVESLLESNSITLTDDTIVSHSIQNCLWDIIQKVVDLADANIESLVDSIPCQNNTVSLFEASTTFASSNDCSVTGDIKMLCKKILLSDSIILSSTKLNKVCKTNMVDVHKACRLLIENGLLTKEKKVLANKSSYYECYLKRIPYDKSSMVDFSVLLAKFGIVDVNTYYDTLKTIDTRNSTYLSPYGMTILEEKPYNDLTINVNKKAIIQPLKERYNELVDVTDIGHGDKEHLALESSDNSASTEKNFEHSASNPKRRRELTGKAREYKEEQAKPRKKKN